MSMDAPQERYTPSLPSKSDKSELIKKIQLKHGNDEAIFENISPNIIQAIYHEITGNTEKLTYSLGKDKAITYENLNDFRVRLMQNCEKYSPIIFNTRIKLELNDGRKYSFSDWFLFSSFDFKTSAATKAVTIEFEFVIKSEIGTHARYKINTIFESAFGIPIHFDYRRFDHYISNKESEISATRTEIEYSNPLVARDFYDIIRDWYGVIADSKFKYYFKSIMIRRRNLYISIEALFSLSFVFPLYLVYKYSVNDDGMLTLTPIFEYAAWVLILNSIHKPFYAIAWSYIDKVMNPPIIMLTTGDNDSKRRRDRTNKINFINFMLMISTTLLSIMINVFSNYIYDYIK